MGGLQVDVGLLLDPLSMCFVLLITFVGTLIHVYSIGYMAHDPDRRRFFAYLNLFVAAMLLLVLADNFLVLYVGWEGVGLASYLLIGFWNYNPTYAAAAKKAFVVNRVGDFGLSVAIMIMFAQFGSVSFDGVFGAADGASEGTLTAIGLMLLLGACGKSAQFPLQSWLGDAMAGPTPVSALIHAATMVTAGVYLIVRSAPIFDGAPDAQLVVVIVGAITLLFGAIIGCAKDDIKKALAASTMSQIGYMMLAAGLGPAGYAFAIFHLLTHGFFKAGMFLGAGSVMHGMNDRVDMRRFGGLSAVMKITWVTFGWAGWPSSAFPAFAGFWSKDKIIEAAFVGDGWRAWVFGIAALLGAGITAFYMTRLIIMTFLGERRWPDDVHPHESPLVMTVPMIVLAVGSALLGLALGPTGAIQHWLEPVVGEHGEESTGAAGPAADHADRAARGGRRRTGLPDVPAPSGRRAVDLGARPGRPPRPLPGRRQRGRAHAARPVPHPVAGLRRQPRHRRRRQRPRRAHRRHVRAGSAACRPGSSARTPCRCSPAPPSWSAPCCW